MSDITSDAASTDGMEGTSQHGLPAAPRSLDEAKEQLLDAISENQATQAIKIIGTWMDHFNAANLKPGDFWLLYVQPILDRVQVPVGGEEHSDGTSADHPSNIIIRELVKSIKRRILLRECFQGALNRRRQVDGRLEQWSDSDDSDDEDDVVVNGNLEVLDNVDGPASAATPATDRVDIAQSKWETIALTFLESHPSHLTPLLSDNKNEPDDVQISNLGMNYLHFAVLNSSAKIVKKLIANIQAHPYHKDHPERRKALMTALDSSKQNYLEIAIDSDILNPELIQCLLCAENTLVHQTEKNGAKSPMPLHLFIIEVAHRAVSRHKDAKCMPSIADCRAIVDSIVDADPTYTLTCSWSGLECQLFEDGKLKEYATPYQLVSNLYERIELKLSKSPGSEESQKLASLRTAFAELKKLLEELIFRHLQGSEIQYAGFDDITELDLSDFDTLESEQQINDLSAFVRGFKPIEEGKGSFSFPNRLARLDLPDMSFGKTSEMASSIKDLFQNLNEFEVNQIMRLYAKDNPKDPVDDESIAKWVEIFKVEELDWQKPDLDIDLFVKMAQSGRSSLKTINLYTNGHWGVLYHWLSIDGLFSILGLSKATIFIIEKQATKEDLNREEDMVKKAEEMRDVNKLKAQEDPKNQKRSITIPEIKIMWRPAPQPGRIMGATSVTLHKRFFTPIELVSDHLSSVLNDNKRRKLYQSKIAVIDNGISFGLSTVCSSIIKGDSTHFNADGRKIPWFTSKDSHGTYMASLITQVNPFCGLLIYRINSWQHDIKLATAIDGIELALKEKKDPPDILNLSWSFSVKSQRLEEVLGRITVTNPTLVFCAKSDEPYTPNVWPADYDTTISVASATTSAQIQRVDKPPDLIILGENMNVEAPSYAIQKEKSVSGSSVATALASGIASLILTLAKTWQFSDWEKLKRRKTMLRVFEEYRKSKSIEIPYLDPKELFSDLEDLKRTLRYILDHD